MYYDQHSISSHLRQVDALLKGLFEGDEHKELHDRWTEIRGKLNDLLPTRNVVAHQPVRRVGTSDGDKPIYVYGIYLEPYQRFVKKAPRGLKGKDALSTEDLITHSEAVDELWFELASFTKKVVATFRDRRT